MSPNAAASAPGRPSSDERMDKTFSLGVETISRLQAIAKATNRTEDAILERALRHYEALLKPTTDFGAFLKALVEFLNAGSPGFSTDLLFETMIDPYLHVQGYSRYLTPKSQLRDKLRECLRPFRENEMAISYLREVRSRIEQMVWIALPSKDNDGVEGKRSDNIDSPGFSNWISETCTFKVNSSCWTGPGATEYVRDYFNSSNPGHHETSLKGIATTIFFDFKFRLIEKVGLAFTSPRGEESPWTKALRRCPVCHAWIFVEGTVQKYCGDSCKQKAAYQRKKGNT